MEKVTLQSKADELQSYLDIEPATGLGVRSKRRFGVSYSIWECDPNTSDNCNLSKRSDDSGSCYATTSNMKYPCSAANLMTPNVVGGKIIPMYWYEDARQEIGDVEVNTITDLANEHYKLFESFFHLWCLGWMSALTIGLGMLFRCFIYSPEKEFLKAGPVGGTVVGSSTSAAASTASSSAEVN